MPLDDPAGEDGGRGEGGAAGPLRLSCEVERTQLARRSSDDVGGPELRADAAPLGRRRTTCPEPDAVAAGTGAGSDEPRPAAQLLLPPPPRVDSDDDVTELGMLVACDSARLAVVLRALGGGRGRSWSRACCAASARTAARALRSRSRSSRSESIRSSASSASTSSRLLLLRRNMGGRCILRWASVVVAGEDGPA